MSRVWVESRIGNQEPVILQADGEYKERGCRGRLTYTWASHTEPSSEKNKEILDLAWGTEKDLIRVLRSQPGIRMEFIQGEETDGRLMTPAGRLDLKVRTTSLQGEYRDRKLTLRLEYSLTVGGQEQGLAEMKIRVEE